MASVQYNGHKVSTARVAAVLMLWFLCLQVEKDIDRDRYMSPIEAMEYGIIDGVIDKDAIIAINELPVVSERVKPRKENLAAMENPRKFLTPEIPDDEIY